MNAPIQPGHPAVPPELLARCEQMGFAVWARGDQGQALIDPDDHGFHAELIQRIDQVFTRWAQAETVTYEAIADDAWLLPLSHPTQPSLRIGVLALTRAALEDAALGLPASRVPPLSERLPTTLDPTQLQRTLQWMLEDQNRGLLQTTAVGQFTQSLTQAYEESQMLYRLARETVHIRTPHHVFAEMARQVRDVLPFDWVALQFSDQGDIREVRGRTIVTGELPHSLEAMVPLLRRAANGYVNDGRAGIRHPGSDPLATAVESEVLTYPVTHTGRTFGWLIAGNKQAEDPEVSSFEMQVLAASADLISVAHENVTRDRQQQAAFVGTIRALSAAVDAKDPYTRGHSERVAWLGKQLAVAANLDADVVERVHISGLLHDVGKIGVPEAVLCKKGRLTDEEFAHIKRHPQLGADILGDLPGLEDVIDGVLYHHERWDGRGYPTGKAGPDVPLFGRLLAVADAFDAMSSSRSYRQAMSRDQVFGEMVSGARTQFDPTLVPLFVELDLTEYDRMVADARGQIWTAA